MTVPRPLLPHLRARLPALGASDRKVAEVVLAQPGTVVFWSVSELADAAGTAKSSVVRFCQGLGLRGFHDLKLVLAQETAVEHRGAGPDASWTGGQRAADGSGGAPAPDLLGTVVWRGVETLRDAAATVARDAFDATATRLAQAHTVLLAGSGSSAPLAHDAAQRLRSIGVLAAAPSDAPGQLVAAALLERGDVCLAISHSGATRGTLAAVTAATDAGATTAAITSYSHSPLTELCDHVLVAGARAASPRVAALTSRLAHVAVLDALLVAVALRDEPRAEAALARTSAALAEQRR
ncbi:MurR/RpiR family transcriptional regulator [Conexibacter stalactiti]|uniref:MurR/RpiR family transcriptional regulator n=1 Tax=Conexibacter stalactiti TaxID=1940611 RepID=A0ABU4HTS8_9ACTN|nr:MurR/RpiR family transcriptional regulator [Conexibacter stalactiti]MDW5596655.1 MurR/RpiR family transcriptional regulator [Conexibacter stalactiti]MEC5037297.1 MurR/RpiR family transcriptional regulator [Conexibacter stalactiti]